MRTCLRPKRVICMRRGDDVRVSAALSRRFLPAVLEVEQTPPSAAGRLLLWSIVLLFVLTFVWSCLGRLDVVAVAAGKIIPHGRTKSVQPAALGVVRQIHVVEGQAVSAGELLVELDADTLHADRERVERELQAARLNLARVVSLLELARADANPDFTPAVPFRLRLDDGQRTRWRQQLEHHNASLAAFAMKLTRARAEFQTIIARIHEVETVLPLLEQHAGALAALMRDDLAPHSQWMTAERDRIAHTGTLEAAVAEQEVIAATIGGLEQERIQYLAERRRMLHEERAQHRLEITRMSRELVKLDVRIEQTQLRSPAAGVVHQLAVHAAGEVVTPAQVLMSIVPTDTTLMAEAWLPNKDSGFVDEGSTVAVKVDAFPFTRFGTVDGTITMLSGDAVTDDDLGLVFTALIKLHRSSIRVGDRDVALAPGMAVTVEARTGSRRVIEFVLSPVLRALRESARER